MSLIPAPTDSELRRLAGERQLERYGRVIDPALLDGAHRDMLIREPTGSRAVAFRGHDGGNRPAFTVAAQADPGFSAPIRARREGNTLWLEIETAPRTKKNNSIYKFGADTPYKKFRADVIGAVHSVFKALELPLPSPKPRDRSVGYNIAVAYYLDRYGVGADRPGLDQGLFDALQDAGVVNDDWYFRTTEGTPVPVKDARPRVEIVITPLPPAEVTP